MNHMLVSFGSKAWFYSWCGVLLILKNLMLRDLVQVESGG